MVQEIKVPGVDTKQLTAQERDQLREQKERETEILEHRRRHVDECVCNNILIMIMMNCH
jgi:hypothetical protein